MTGRQRVLRELFGSVAPAAWLALAVAPIVWAWSRLPEPMASHWSLRGEPDGAMPRAALLAFDAIAAAVPAVIAFAATRRAPSRRRHIVPGLSMATFAGLLIAGLAVASVALNLDAPTWRLARPMSFGWLAGPLAAAALAALAASRLGARLETLADPPEAGALPSVALGATERAVWAGSVGNPWLAAGGLALACAGLLALPLAPGSLPLLLLAGGAALGAFAVVRVRIDGSGVTMAYGPLGFPRQRVPLRRIRGARVVDVVPLRHGGWGYRGSLVLFRRAAIVVRRGPGIELDCGRRGVLFITVDDPEPGAGLVNDLVARERPAG